MSDSRPAEFDPLRVETTGTHLVEANAGTGKTHSLCALFLRVVVEGRIDLGTIALVTFTDAAARELRERLLGRLRELARILQQPAAADANPSWAVELLALAPAEPADALARRVRDALLRFDEVTVATIHGFCRRALERLGLATGVRESVDPGPLRDGLVADFWRQRVLGGDAAEAAWALTRWREPTELARDLVDAHALPTTALDPPRDRRTLDEAAQRLRRARAEGRALYDRGLLDATMAHLEDAVYLAASGDRYDNGGLERIKRVLADWFVSGQEGQWPLAELELLRPATVLTFSSSRYSPKGWDAPRNPLTDWIEAWYEEAAGHERERTAQFRHDALGFVATGMQRLRAESGAWTHDELIAELDAALQRPESVARLARRWRLGVVDEFQDTDARQYAIFRRIFARAGSALFLVGDPKQAIYRFRGGDIHAYAQAARDADRRWSLSGNWRADPALVEAINALFARGGAERPFLVDFIDYRASHWPAERKLEPSPWTTDAPLVLWHAASTGSGARPARDAMTALATQATAAEIARLLAHACAQGVPAPSIAVLAPTHRDLAAMARTLRDWRIPAVAQERESVYANPAVADLAHLLRALLDGGERAFAGAMALPLFGLPLAQLAAARAQAGADAGWALREALRECWRERGPLALLLRVLAEVAPRWIGAAEGPRRHADLLQVGEFLEAQRAAGGGMDAELVWLEARRHAAQAGLAARDERPRPLEGTGAVRLLTTHAAKGLQFDVVFAPFLWRSRGGQRPVGEPPVQYHDASGILRVDLGSPELEAHRQVQEIEMQQEGLRQAYVALTRARRRCYTIWGRCRGMEQAPLAALLHPQLAPDGVLAAAPDEATLVDALARLAHAGGGAIEVTPLPRPDGPAPLPLDAPPLLAARTPVRVVLPARRTLSFSALAASGTDAVADHDGGDPARLGDPLAEVGPIPAYPRGARVGECVHLALERIDFARWPDVAGRASLDLACRRFRFGEAEREVFEDWIGQAVNAALLPGLTLAGLDPAASARELEFHFRLAGSARRLEAALALEPRHARDAAEIARLPARMHGLMHGYIDLVLQHEGRWYVVDYKTNFLGGELDHYAPQALAAAVREGDYDLQYLIYLVALHRQLRHRLGRTYDPERQLGGALYLFLRGMSRDGARGVHRDRPPVALVEALDRAFDDGVEQPWP